MLIVKELPTSAMLTPARVNTLIITSMHFVFVNTVFSFFFSLFFFFFFCVCVCVCVCVQFLFLFWFLLVFCHMKTMSLCNDQCFKTLHDHKLAWGLCCHSRFDDKVTGVSEI